MKKRDYLREIIADSQAEILALLAEMVNINSFSHHPDGINKVGEIVARTMPENFSHEIEINPDGVHHHKFTQLAGGKIPIILGGHIDTLCPPDPEFDTLKDEGDILRGPGVNDMKGGDVVLIWALKALEHCGKLAELPLVCIFNGDEEIGSPTSHPIFYGMGGKAALGLIFECGGPDDTIVTTRKSVARYRLNITGKPNHFGNLKEPKISAVEEMAHKILMVEAMNRADKSIVANVGRAEGGLAANAVAAKAFMEFEARYWDPVLEPEVLGKIEELQNPAKVPDCQLNLKRLSYRPPMQPTPASMRIFDMIVARGKQMGMNIIEEKRGGVSDACWLSHAGIPTIDGLGPLGDHDFTPREYIRKDTLFNRIELTANLLLDLLESGMV